jgi:hypothetical protein
MTSSFLGNRDQRDGQVLTPEVPETGLRDEHVISTDYSCSSVENNEDGTEIGKFVTSQLDSLLRCRSLWSLYSKIDQISKNSVFDGLLKTESMKFIVNEIPRETLQKLVDIQTRDVRDAMIPFRRANRSGDREFESSKDWERGIRAINSAIVDFVKAAYISFLRTDGNLDIWSLALTIKALVKSVHRLKGGFTVDKDSLDPWFDYLYNPDKSSRKVERPNDIINSVVNAKDKEALMILLPSEWEALYGAESLSWPTPRTSAPRTSVPRPKAQLKFACGFACKRKHRKLCVELNKFMDDHLSIYVDKPSVNKPVSTCVEDIMILSERIASFKHLDCPQHDRMEFISQKIPVEVKKKLFDCTMAQLDNDINAAAGDEKIKNYQALTVEFIKTAYAVYLWSDVPRKVWFDLKYTRKINTLRKKLREEQMDYCGWNSIMPWFDLLFYNKTCTESRYDQIYHMISVVRDAQDQQALKILLPYEALLEKHKAFKELMFINRRSRKHVPGFIRKHVHQKAIGAFDGKTLES